MKINKIVSMSAVMAMIAMNVNAQTEERPDSLEEVNVAFKTVKKADLLGGVSSIDMVELTKKNYTTYAIDNLDAYVGGYTWSSLWSQGDALILVDGVPRDANNVLPTEIDQVTFLKGASAVVLYGSRAAKGVILITTKRGKRDGLHVDVRGNATLNVPKRYQEYLGGAEYMQLYNEALANDGNAPVYTQDQIYHTALGDNPYRYPDLNFYSSDYIKKNYMRYDANAEFEGGGGFAHFYANVGFYHVGDLMNFGEGKDNHTNRLNVRGNIDLRMNDWISGWVDANATFYDARGDKSDYWSSAATIRPTSQYPLVPLIPIEYLEANDANSQALVNNSKYLIDGKYLLGGTQNQQTNPFAAMYAAGYNQFTSRQFQFDAGIKMDLSKVLKGLSFRTQFAVDYATSYNTSIDNEYATYEASWNNYSGKDLITSLTKYGVDRSTAKQNLSGSYDKQTIMFSGQFDYNRTFGDHKVNATLLAHGYQQSETGVYHRTSNANLGLQIGYNYKNKYYADFSAAAIHSAKLAEGHREAISPTVSAAWRLSEEDFMKDVSWIDDLKLNASWGIINQDLDISDYYMYDNIFTATGTWWGWNEIANSMQTSDSRRGGNDDLTFIKRKEFRVGLDMSMFKGDVKLNANFFNINTNGLLTTPSTIFPGYFHTYWPETSFLPYMNFNNRRHTGIDFTLNLHKKVGEVDLNLGLAGMWTTNKNTKVSENVEYDWQKSEGQRVDALRGYECLGFFKDQADVDASAKINNNTKPGDLKYKDQNGDGLIDSKDQVIIGQYNADFNYGINLTAKYKNFTLFVNGTGSVGGNGIKSNSAWWVYGDGKYSDVVRGRWTPETAATATYPRLTTGGGELNFVNSDFWMYDTSAFYLNKVQLTYDFPAKMFQGKVVKGLSLYVYGSGLLTIAKERKYLETNVGGSPDCRSYNFGVKVNL